MGKPTGFLDYTRVDCPLRDAAARTGDYAPVELPLSERNRRRQSGRCMDCGVPFCQAGVSFEGVLLGCPLHNLIPEWNDLLWNGDYEGALQRLLKTSPFPEFTGRVCPALCERACVCGQVSQPVTIRENELSIPLPGGLLIYGIPEMKLPKQIVARRISLMKREGIGFRTSCCVGKQIGPEELAAQFDLVIFCCGAQQPRPLPFAETAGVFYALDYLRASAQSLLEKTEPAVTASGKQVVLVGAGDSASDCISVALRQGCQSITQLIRKPRTEQTEKRDHAHEEAEAVFGADIRRYETQIERLVCGDDDSVNAVILQGSGEQLPCDLLLLASGFSGCEPTSVDAYEAVRKTGVPALTAGDMASGASLVVLAAASGKQAAAQADASLMGYTNIL